ncbi:hypothetical protein HDV05_005052 [Chytridiales sp. JEL 0842]|nr:hypothetical protein HDV05_005052 [Chytridiales sp. JEL 0842]
MSATVTPKRADKDGGDMKQTDALLISLLEEERSKDAGTLLRDLRLVWKYGIDLNPPPSRLLVSLNLSKRDLADLPTEIGLLTKLETLSLASNSLSSLPSNVLNLRQLRYLNLRSNSFREIPSVLLNIYTLEILDISRNKIKRLPARFGGLMNLKVLSLTKNRIQSLPTYMGQMKELIVLKIENNPIQWPPPNITVCPEDRSPEEWLSSLKAFLVQEGLRHNALQETNLNPTSSGIAGDKPLQRDRLKVGRTVLDVPTEPTHFPELPKDPFASSAESPRSSLVESATQDCVSLMDYYQATFHPYTPHPTLDVARTIAFSSTSLIRALKPLIAKIPKGKLLKPFDGVSADLNSKTQSTIQHLISIEERVSSSSEPTTELSDLLNATSTDFKDLRTAVLSVATSLKQVLKIMDDNLNVFLTHLDKLSSRNLVAVWYACNTEMSITLQALTGSMRSQIQLAQQKEEAASASLLEGKEDEEVVKLVVDEDVVNAIYKAATTTGETVRLLETLPEEAISTLGTVKSENDEQGVGSAKDFKDLLESAKGTIEKLLSLRNNWIHNSGAGVESKVPTMLHEQSMALVQLVVKVSSAVRLIAAEFPLSKTIKNQLKLSMRTTKELAVVLSNKGVDT